MHSVDSNVGTDFTGIFRFEYSIPITGIFHRFLIKLGNSDSNLFSEGAKYVTNIFFNGTVLCFACLLRHTISI